MTTLAVQWSQATIGAATGEAKRVCPWVPLFPLHHQGPPPHWHSRGLFWDRQGPSLRLQQVVFTAVLSMPPLKLNSCAPLPALQPTWLPWEGQSWLWIRSSDLTAGNLCIKDLIIHTVKAEVHSRGLELGLGPKWLHSCFDAWGGF